ncbi:REP-associated tyrosine transposase [Pseudomonas sp. 5P_3.1_Bac2]|uniref:REP-associated tyrosine transposase n=1 Tax=Pseudomonas sp. 5P_3.1_Bac2 TaxID=2971617 RepID=UPI0021C859EF|nr:transposase [Pseudomonas sp. 5P_3.1_Bac2]MCU1718119.1 transposase [Pseudomonas sp. 5P_3.1_Bac2]
MPNYRRALQDGGTWFFTVNLWQRRHNDLLVRHVEVLRAAVKRAQGLRPWQVDAWVVLPEHMHCVWTLPPGDSDFALRWRWIKSHFSQSLPATEARSPSRVLRGERGIWQRRYWEHWIRDDEDYRRHVDYVHVNPLKHGLVSCVADWPYSTFHRDVRRGLYPKDWAGDASVNVLGDI